MRKHYYWPNPELLTVSLTCDVGNMYTQNELVASTCDMLLVAMILSWTDHQLLCELYRCQALISSDSRSPYAWDVHTRPAYASPRSVLQNSHSNDVSQSLQFVHPSGTHCMRASATQILCRCHTLSCTHGIMIHS
jgi:hypothetical protein